MSEQHITNPADLRKYRHELPNLADDELDPYEYRLYGHYVRVGECWESTRTTATKTQMSIGMVVKTRKALADKGWIALEENTFGTFNITILDKWGENFIKYASDSNMLSSVHVVNDTVVKCSPGEPKNLVVVVNDEIDENEELPPYRLHEICFGFTPSFTVLQRLTELIEEYTYSWVKEAMEIAANQGKPKIAYVEGILKKWRLDGRDASKPEQPYRYVDPAYRGERKQFS